MAESPAYYGPPRNVVRTAARELSAIAVKLDSLSECMPSPCDRDVLEFLVLRVANCLDLLSKAARHCHGAE